MEIDDEKFEKIKGEAKEFYRQLDKVRCPYLDTEINFNSEGFEHLLTKSWNRGRSHVEQYMRLRLLPKVVEIIKKSHTLQEYDERKIFVRQKINSRWEKHAKNVKYYVFISLIIEKGIRFKIIIKHIEGGEPFFWSIYPSWRIEKDSNGNKKKISYTGNLEED